jgi:L-ascorbate metabolism protein UlaG (beta-lactamase superfamily)
MRLTYYGHSCFLVETAGKRLLLDPFLTDNPKAPVKAGEVDCHFILCSHAHVDHTGDAVRLAKRCKAPIIAPYELAMHFAGQGVEAVDMNPGGSSAFPFGRVKLTLAHHSSSLDEQGGEYRYMGSPCGIVIQSDEKTVYHAGDTALFMDMQLIGHLGLDAALVPIGDCYTMGPSDALEALDFLRPKLAVPIHYNTWPKIEQDADKFAAEAAVRGHDVRVLRPGDELDL